MQHRARLTIIAMVLAGPVLGASSASPCEKGEYSVRGECKDSSNTRAKDAYLKGPEAQKSKLTSDIDNLEEGAVLYQSESVGTVGGLWLDPSGESLLLAADLALSSQRISALVKEAERRAPVEFEHTQCP